MASIKRDRPEAVLSYFRRHGVRPMAEKWAEDSGIEARPAVTAWIEP